VRKGNVPDRRPGTELRPDPGNRIQSVVSGSKEEATAKTRIGPDRPTHTARHEAASVRQARDCKKVDAPQRSDPVRPLDGKRIPAEDLKLSPLERIRRHDAEEVFRARGPESVVLLLGDHVEIPSP
jgi:hypothetical protein